jgi:hypothetical protein
MLSRRGLPHPVVCPFCDQVGESLDNLMMGCVLTREVWSTCLRWWGKLHWMPQPDIRLVCWLQEKRGGLRADRDFWTDVTLISWCLCRHRNVVVFKGVAPSKLAVILRIPDETELWRLAGLFGGVLASVDR